MAGILEEVPAVSNLLQETKEILPDTVKQQITDFVSSETPVVIDTTRSQEKEITPLFKETAGEPQEHTIKTFLERAQIIVEGVVASTDQVHSILLFEKLPDIILKNSILQCKIRGFKAGRFTMCFKLVVQKQPFQAGILMLAALPISSVCERDNSYYANINQQSGGPSVMLNLAETNDVSLKIPFIAPQVFYDLVDPVTNLGTLAMSVVSPIVSAAATNVPYTLYGWLEEPEIEFPVAKLPKSYGTVQERAREILKYMGKDNPTIEEIEKITLMVPQSAETSKSTLMKRAQNYKSLRNNRTIHNLSDVNKLIAAPNLGTASGSQPSHVHSYDVNVNQATMDSLYNATEDDMNIDNILRKPVLNTSFNWNTSQAAKTRIFSAPVNNQGVMWTSTQISTAQRAYASMTDYIHFLSNFFLYWRGIIVYKFDIAKTNFHSGRIAVTFVPNSFGQNDTADLNTVYTKIIDIQSGPSSFEFEVPFVSDTLYKQCLKRNKDITGYSDYWEGANYENTTGSVFVYVLNPLRAPNTVANSVNIVVSRYAKNFSFAGVSPITFTSAVFFKEIAKEETKVNMVPQADDEIEDENQQDEDIISGRNFTAKQMKMSTFSKQNVSKYRQFLSHVCVGEHVSTLKTIIQLPHHKIAVNFQDGGDLVLAQSSYTSREIHDSGIPSNFPVDKLDILAQMYGLSTGGVNLTFAPLDDNKLIESWQLPIWNIYGGNTTQFTTWSYPYDSSHQLVVQNKYLILDSASRTISDPQVEPIMSISYPYRASTPVVYNTCHRQGVGDDITTQIRAYALSNSIALVKNIKNFIFRAANPDFKFYFLTGPPAISWTNYSYDVEPER